MFLLLSADSSNRFPLFLKSVFKFSSGIYSSVMCEALCLCLSFYIIIKLFFIVNLKYHFIWSKWKNKFSPAFLCIALGGCTWRTCSTHNQGCNWLCEIWDWITAIKKLSDNQVFFWKKKVVPVGVVYWV